jgi:hypothetical protein
LLRSCLIADCDEQRCDVLAVVARLLKCGAAALGRDAVAAQLNRRLVRICVRALDAGRGVGLVDLKLTYDFTLLVV